MVIDYLLWQYWHGPQWLVRLLWVMQRSLWQYFSVPVMLQTLLSPWRHDQVSLQQGGLPAILKALAWNAISRLIGAVVRTSVIITFLFTEAVFIGAAALIFSAFLVWPLAVGYGLLISLQAGFTL